MGDQTPDCFFNNDTFKSCFARSVVVNSPNLKQPKSGQAVERAVSAITDKPTELSSLQETPVRYRKNSRNSIGDDSRRYSCGSIVSRRASMIGLKRNEIPVENIYNQNKIDTLQWQLKEIEKSREMHKAVLKQVVTFLEKAHVSLESLGKRLNRKNSVSRSKSEHHIVGDSISNTSANQRLLIEEHISSWNSNKHDAPPEEIPPEKLSQEAFRLLRTAQSLLNIQEPSLASADSPSSYPSDPTDFEFLALLAKEFPSDAQKPQRATSFSLTPKLILPENEVRISTAFNRKLSLQLNEVKRKSGGHFSQSDSARGSVAESEPLSLSTVDHLDRMVNGDPLRGVADLLESRCKDDKKTSGSPASGSVSSMEDESGFSSLTSFQDVGLPIINSTGIEELSPRSVFLKSILQEPDPRSDESTRTLRASPPPATRFQKKSEARKREMTINGKDTKLWQKPSEMRFTPAIPLQVSHKPNPDSPSANPLKVLWV